MDALTRGDAVAVEQENCEMLRAGSVDPREFQETVATAAAGSDDIPLALLVRDRWVQVSGEAAGDHVDHGDHPDGTGTGWLLIDVVRELQCGREPPG